MSESPQKRQRTDSTLNGSVHTLPHMEIHHQDQPSSDNSNTLLLPTASSFAEFLSDPLSFSPSEEFISSSYYIEDDTALIAAIKSLNSIAVSALLDAGCDPNAINKKGVTPISAAAHKGDTNIIQLLIRKGALVNAVNNSGSTALIQASHFGHFNAVLLLLQCGGAADFANSKGTTALMRASQEGHEGISRLLIEARVDVNKKNHEGMNALMLASQRGHGNVVMELIKSGAMMDEQTAQGSTALMLACKRGHEKVVEVLVSMGAEIYMRDCRGRTALDTAMRRHHHHLLQYLNTQVQVRCVQEHARRERAALLKEMRSACMSNRLELKKDTAVLQSLYNTMSRPTSGPHPSIPDGLDSLAEVASSHTPDSLSGCSSLSKLISADGGMELCRQLAAAISDCQSPSARPTEMQPARVGYAGWQWPFILMRCMQLPLGLCEIIMEYLPLPRIWRWSLNRLKKRIPLAPHAATVDVSLVLDEMITDTNIFAGRQRGHLIRIARSSDAQRTLCKDFRLSPILVDSIVCFSDVQSLSYRYIENDVAFKQSLAKKYLTLAVMLYRHLKVLNDPCLMFISSLLADMKRGGEAVGSARKAYANAEGGITLLDGNVVFGGELALMDDDDGLNEYDLNVTGGGPDQDTETEMPAEGDMIDDGNFQASDDDNRWG